jgi:signal transduction histidine kinase
MFFQSIRFKMMLWYMLLLTVTLLSFSSILYGSFNKLLYANLDDLLSSRAEGVANSVTAYWGAKQVEIQHDGPKLADFSKIAANWVEEKRKDPELMSIFVRVLSRNGELVVASKNMPVLEALDKEDLSDVLSGDEDFSTLKGETADGKKVKFRVYSRPVTEGAEVEYIVQVAGPASLITLASTNLFWALFILLPITVILAGVPGVVLVRLTLKPVDEMIKALKQTTAENLKLKIHLPDTKDEIKRLADTFNEMIDRLDRSFSSQQSFIQDISAELKSPLETLKKEFESGSGRALSSDEYAAMLRKGLEELSRFERVIEELETLAKFDNNRMALEIRKVNLSKLIERALDNIRQDALKKDIGVSSVLKDPIIIDGDEKQLMRLFSGLLDNAVKYTNRKGAVTIAARKNHRSAVITVSDTGIGIEDNELPYIFDRFYQVKKSRVSSGSFGLGLSIVKSVAEVHKGTIAVESKPGKGSVFTVVLPLSYPA